MTIIDLDTVAGVVVEVDTDTVEVVLGGGQYVQVVGTNAVGPPGPGGADGATGAAGPAGADGADGLDGGSYRHVQGVPSAVWTIVHHLGVNPGGVSVVH